jgi:30S ribosomal protein S31
MGKGDKKSRRGKIIIGTYGVRRRKKKLSASEVKPEIKVKEVKLRDKKPLKEKKEIKEVKEVKEVKEIKNKKENKEPKAPIEKKEVKGGTKTKTAAKKKTEE